VRIVISWQKWLYIFAADAILNSEANASAGEREE
jgi:hypothetical protein